MKKLPSKAYTLVEMMVTLAILATILSLALISMRGYIPKQRLLGSIGELENFFQRAQAEASSRSYWTCVTFDATSDPISATLWADLASNHGNTGACSDAGGAREIATTQLKKSVIFAPSGNTGCNNNVTPTCVVWFDSTGLPKKCANSGACGGTSPSSSCVDASYQFVLSNPNLEPGTRARELEIISGGLIQGVTLGKKGLDQSFFAKGSSLTTGCE